MNMQPVESSNLAAVGYDPTTSTLAVRFTNGTLYHYPDVKPALHDQLMAAESKGKFFNANLRSLRATRIAA